MPDYKPTVADFQPRVQVSDLHLPTDGAKQYYNNVLNTMGILDSRLGFYYRLEVAILCVAKNAERRPDAVVINKEYPSEADRRLEALRSIDLVWPSLRPQQLAYMTHPAELPCDGVNEPLNYYAQIPSYTYATLRPSVGPFTLEFLQQVQYLRDWGRANKPAGTSMKTNFYPSPTGGKQMDFDFCIFRTNPAANDGWERVINGGLIWHGPADPLDLDVEEHSGRWSALWQVHT